MDVDVDDGNDTCTPDKVLQDSEYVDEVTFVPEIIFPLSDGNNDVY